jgi:hypothetical protein
MVDLTQRSFVELARDNIDETMARWHEILDSHKELLGPTIVDPLDLQEMVGRLLSDHIMLLRAVEEVEGRPWWRRRRYNPYAR